MTEKLQNWAGNLTYSAARVHSPATVAQVQELVRGSGKLRALGSRHSFNTIADTTEDLVSLAQLNRVVALDREARTVTVEGGITYGQLGLALQAEGFALHNMASLPHISVAGACATATHGSGDGNGNLATAVCALEFVAADGELVRLSRERDGDVFGGAAVSLGGLGLITQLTLDIQPSFVMQQEVYENLPTAQLDADFEAVVSSAYSVSLFTDWHSERIGQVWIKRHLPEGAALDVAPSFFGAAPATAARHPIAGLPADPCTVQLGVAGPWHERLPHFRIDQTPSIGAELQSEYFVPRAQAVAALRELRALHEQIAPLLMVSEVRTVAADTLWLSPCYNEAQVGLHFTFKRDEPAVRRLLPQIEQRLAPLGARPHWGKLFTMEPAHVRSLYQRLPDFQALLRRYDPQGKFRNAFLETYVA